SRNEILCVVGESGSGKSIMAKTVMGLLPKRLTVAGGEIVYEGAELLKISEPAWRAMRGQAMAMIFQEPMSALNPLNTIGDQIEEVVKVHTRHKKPERRNMVLEILEAVRLPDPRKIVHAYPHELSGGQRQRAMIAMALILKPDLLIADEPTTALDVTTQAGILDLVKEIQAERSTGVLFITHDIGVVAEIADNVVVMKEGRIVEHGTTEEILRRPRRDYTRMLISAVPSLKTVRRDPTGAVREDALKIENLVKTFRTGGLLSGTREVKAVSDVSLSVRRGETLGIVGESGSGKSTLARCVIRLVDPDSGRILFDGHDIAVLSRSKMLPLRSRIQMIFQDPYGSLNPRLTVAKMVAQGPMLHGTPADDAKARALELLKLVGLDESAANRYPHEFSGGQRQRIGIARALALQPEILVADEPVSALDVSVQAQVLRLLADIREKFHLTMIFITHDLRVAAQVCDTVAVMQLGKVVEFGATHDVFTAPKHSYTQKLLASIPGKDWDFALAAR
ncbi:MAG: ABC transporter ATP-binding protein, partial [Gemmatimonadetes bacterium]|nr:ABC transporter ATP-binding protein [Gemmatimonadota bacterium]